MIAINSARMQVIPLFAFLLGRVTPRWTERRRVAAVAGFSALYLMGGAALYLASSRAPVLSFA